jgi:hypothetical protein
VVVQGVLKQTKKYVIPAHAGIQKGRLLGRYASWTPAYAGVTMLFNALFACAGVTMLFNALFACTEVRMTFNALIVCAVVTVSCNGLAV